MTVDYQRYNPHILLPQIGIEGQKKLLNSKVLIVGMGGLGCPVALYLASSGIGTLGLVDHDIIEISNLHRQVLYTPSDVGKRKAEISKQKLTEINPEIHIQTYSEWLSADNAQNILSQYDLIVDATDNFNTRYLINDYCLILNKTMVHGSVFQFEGQVSVFGNQGPCYRCIYPVPFSPKTIPNCTESGVLGMLPGLIGMIQAQEVIKLILNIGKPLFGRLLLYNGLESKWHELSISKNKKCPSCSKPLALPIEKEYSIPCATRTEITTQELKQYLDNNKEKLLIIDVREKNEYHLGCIPNALLMPLSCFETEVSSIKNLEKKLIVVACQSGVRSKKAVQFLCNKGFKHVKSLKGGIQAWISWT